MWKPEQRIVIGEALELITFGGFERLIAFLFDRLPGWSAQLQGSATTPDGGVDVIATSPSGIVYAIQAKFWNAKSVGPSDIDKTFAVQHILRADHAIVIGKGEGLEDIFTKSARERARKLEVWLWSERELQALADVFHDPTPYRLRSLGLDSSVPSSPLPIETTVPVSASSGSTVTKTVAAWDTKTSRGGVEVDPSNLASPPRPRSRAFSLAAVFGAVALGGLAAAWLVPKTPSSEELLAQAIQVAVDYDPAYQEALATSRTEGLEGHITGEEWAKVSGRIAERAASGCVIETTVNQPMFVHSSRLDSPNTATVALWKDWTQRQVCPTGTTLVSNGAFVIGYRLERFGDRWKVAAGELQ